MEKLISAPQKNRGFALVITLSLMILLTILAVGLLSLSAISTRSSSMSNSSAEARANARLALMLAIGELQKNVGPDTRITAPSDIVEHQLSSSAAKGPPLLGVWKSWEGSDHEQSALAGTPIPPIYSDKTKLTTAGGRFLTWLISRTGTGAAPTNPNGLAYGSSTTDTIPLMSTGTLPTSDTRQVHVVPQFVNGQGTMAWWVSGENQKARLPQPYQPKSDTAAGWSDLARSHTVADTKPFQLEALLTDPAPAVKAITLNTADLIVAQNATTKPAEAFHDLSVNSVGLLTNTATGGWRKDLSLVTENWDALPASGLPFFRIDANNTSASSKPTASLPHAPQSIFYPWSAYWSGSGGAPIYQHGAVSSWHNLKDYATAYRRITASGGTHTTPFIAVNLVDAAKSFAYLHNIRTTPLIAACTGCSPTAPHY